MDNDDYFSQRNVVHRYFHVKTDDSGEIQTRDVEGLDENDRPTEVIVIHPHGFSSNPMEDGHMIGIPMGHHRDLIMLLGGEHPDHRPTDLDPGDAAFYNTQGNVLLQTKGTDLSLTLPGTWDVDKLQKLNVNIGGSTLVMTPQSCTMTFGGCTFEFSTQGFKQTGGQQMHDEHDVGKTHMHTEVKAGSELTGPPE